MANVNERNVEQILQSSLLPGLKVTLYIPLSNDLSKRTFLKKALLRTAKNILHRELFPHEVKHLLRDLYELDLDVEKGGTLALFRSKNELFKLYLDEVVQPKIVVSESFHVKSLIWSLRQKLVSRVLFIQGPYLSFHEITLDDCSLLGRTFLNKKDQTKGKLQETINKMMSLEKNDSSQLANYLSYRMEIPTSSHFNIQWRIIHVNSSDRQTFQNIVKDLRTDMILRNQASKKSFIRDIISHGDLIKEKRPDLIAKKLIVGDLNSLCVSHDDLLWGELDRQDGSIKYFPHQRSAKDDDVLDDLLEIANKRNIPFEIVSKDELPQGITAIAC